MERYKYLIGTSHIDPDNGLLYKVTKVEEKNYRGQGTFIVAYRAQVLANGKLSTKCDKEGYHVRDIEKYYEDYKNSTQERFPQASENIQSSEPGLRRSSRLNSG